MFSFLMQIHMYQDWDMLYLLEGGRHLLSGGTYVTDVFENNPPLIYYFSMGIIFLSDLLDINNVFFFKLVIYLCILYSLSVSYYLLIVNSLKVNANFFMLLALAFCFLILSVCCFGEREHLMLLFTIPYFFLLHQSASAIKFKPILRMTISFLAALGFALKPYFLFSLFFSELLFMYWQRDWKTLFRLEAQIIFWTLVVYLVSVEFFMPDFYSTILPYIIQFYRFNGNDISSLLINPAVINALFLLLSSLFLFRFLSRLDMLLITVSFGFMLSFILQGKGWAYHAFPLITVNSLLAVLLVYHLAQTCNKNRIYPGLIISIIAAQFLFTLIPWSALYHQKINYYINESSKFQQMIKIAKQYAQNKYIFFFSTDLSQTILINYYSDSKLGSRFPTLWPLLGIINRQFVLQQCDEICMIGKKKMRHYILEDFQRYQPELVYVDVKSEKAFFRTSFDYLEFMQASSAFRTLWQQYSYLLTIDNYAIYKCNKVS